MCGLGMNMKTCFSMVLWENTGFRVQGSGWKSHFCPHYGPLSGWCTSGGLLPAITQGCPLPPFGRLYRWNERQGFLSVCPSIYFQKCVMVCNEGNIYSKPYYKEKRSNSVEEGWDGKKHIHTLNWPSNREVFRSSDERGEEQWVHPAFGIAAQGKPGDWPPPAKDGILICLLKTNKTHTLKYLP